LLVEIRIAIQGIDSHWYNCSIVGLNISVPKNTYQDSGTD
jgi:hypothetical protein